MYRSARRFLKHSLIYVLQKNGYQVRPRSAYYEEDSYEFAKKVKDAQYYTVWDPPCPLFSPWSGHPEFLEYYDGVAPYTLVSPDRCYVLASLAKHASNLEGDFA